MHRVLFQRRNGDEREEKGAASHAQTTEACAARNEYCKFKIDKIHFSSNGTHSSEECTFTARRQRTSNEEVEYKRKRRKENRCLSIANLNNIAQNK